MSKDIWSNKKEQSKAKRYIIELIKKRLSRKYKRNKLKIEDIKWDVARWEIREISPMGISHLSAREKKRTNSYSRWSAFYTVSPYDHWVRNDLKLTLQHDFARSTIMQTASKCSWARMKKALEPMLKLLHTKKRDSKRKPAAR